MAPFRCTTAGPRTHRCATGALPRRVQPHRRTTRASRWSEAASPLGTAPAHTTSNPAARRADGIGAASEACPRGRLPRAPCDNSARPREINFRPTLSLLLSETPAGEIRPTHAKKEVKSQQLRVVDFGPSPAVRPSPSSELDGVEPSQRLLAPISPLTPNCRRTTAPREPDLATHAPGGYEFTQGGRHRAVLRCPPGALSVDHGE